MLKESDLDPITRELIDTALKRRLMPLCWHVNHDEGAEPAATGYVTVSLLHEADRIRREWADSLELDGDGSGGYAGRFGSLNLRLPDAIDPDEHCRVCRRPFDPRDPRPDGHMRSGGGDVCRACVADRKHSQQ